MFHGDDRSYVIAPLSSIVDERYTVRILSTALPPSSSTPTTSHTNLYTQFCLLVQGNPPLPGGGGGGCFACNGSLNFCSDAIYAMPPMWHGQALVRRLSSFALPNESFDVAVILRTTQVSHCSSSTPVQSLQSLMQGCIALQAYFEFVRPTASSFNGFSWRKGALLAVLVLGSIVAIHPAMSLCLHTCKLVVTVKCMLGLPGQLESPNWTWDVCDFFSRSLPKLCACLEYCRDSFSPPAVDINKAAVATNALRSSHSSEGSPSDSIGTAAIQGSAQSPDQAKCASSRAAVKQASSAEGHHAPTAAQLCSGGSPAEVGGAARAGQCLAAAHQLTGDGVSAPEAFSPPAPSAIQVIFGTVSTWAGHGCPTSQAQIACSRIREVPTFEIICVGHLNCTCGQISTLTNECIFHERIRQTVR